MGTTYICNSYIIIIIINKEILALLIGGKTNVLSNQMRGSGFLANGGHLGMMACASRARIDVGTSLIYVAK